MLLPGETLTKTHLASFSSTKDGDTNNLALEYTRAKRNSFQNFALNICMHNFTKDKLPRMSSDSIIPISNIHSHGTSQRQMYVIPLYKTKVGSHFIQKTGVESWHNIIELVELDNTYIIEKKN